MVELCHGICWFMMMTLFWLLIWMGVVNYTMRTRTTSLDKKTCPYVCLITGWDNKRPIYYQIFSFGQINSTVHQNKYISQTKIIIIIHLHLHFSKHPTVLVEIFFTIKLVCPQIISPFLDRLFLVYFSYLLPTFVNSARTANNQS